MIDPPAKADLRDPRISALRNLIGESFRVRKNHNPIYVDIGSNLARVRSKQHQVVFGRRGSGKSCLLIHFINELKAQRDVRSIYVQMDEFKRLTYPDVLIRVLIEILGATPVPFRRLRKLFRIPALSDRLVANLRGLLDVAEEAEIVTRAGSEQTSGMSADVAGLPAAAKLNSSRTHTKDTTSTFRAKKRDVLERHLKDYKKVLEESRTSAHGIHTCIVVDDFYLLERESQPDVLDYLHRLVRDTDHYLKIATVRHRTALARNHPHTVGLELSQDVEAIDLDRTLEDLPSTQAFLGEMLDALGQQVGFEPERVSEQILNPEALEALTLASGGVPRDFLTVLMYALEAADSSGQHRWLTPTLVHKGAARLAWLTKLGAMREDVSSDSATLERLVTDLLSFCLKEQRKTAFLIAQDEVQREPEAFELIQQLMDFKLIHIVEPDTSAASGRTGRFVAYTLDFSFFMDPRRRNIEIVEFWKIDDQRRRRGIREAPVYPLLRARQACVDTARPQDPVPLLTETEESSAASAVISR